MSKSAARRNSATVARSVSGKVLAGPRFGLIEQLEARTLLAAAGGAEGLEIALAAEATYLSDLNWASVTSPYSGAKKDQSSGGKPMSIGGVSYAKGVGVHSASEIVYNLGGQYTTFQAYVGIDDSVGDSAAHGSSQFLVYVDGVLSHTSSRRDGSQPAELIEVDVTGAQTLRLVTNTGGNPGDNDYKDHANWADAKLLSTPAEPKPAVSVTTTDATVAENGAPDRASFTISRTGPTDEPLVVHYTIGGTAAAGIDYTALAASATIPAGESSVSVFVDPIDDSAYEGNETVILTLATSSSYTVSAGSATVTIVEDDAAPPVDESTYLSDLDWDSATSPFGGAQKDRSAGKVPLQIGGVTYAKGIGVHSPSELVYSLAGQYTRFQAFVGINDSVGNGTHDGSAQFLVYVDGVLKHTSSRRDGSQPAEFIDVDITGAQTLRLVTNTGGNPGDNDYKDHANWADAKLLSTPAEPKPAVSITTTDATVAENGAPDRASFTISRTGPTDEPLVVHYTIGGTAAAGIDYTALAASATIPAGESSVSVFVDPIDDDVYEGDETVIITLAADSAYTLGTSTTSITITEDDAEPVKPTIAVAATDASAAETNTGEAANLGVFTLTRSGDTTDALTVNFTLAGTATISADYAAVPLSATFAAGLATATVTIAPINDAIFEGSETVIFTLSQGGHYIVDPTASTATITIADNDTAPPVEEFIYLSDLNWVSAVSPYSSAKKNTSAGGQPMSIGGVSYAKGVGVHSASELVYNVGGQYTRFTAYVGIDDSVGNSPSHGSSQFMVYVDGVLKHTSSRRDGSQPAEFIDVDITGAQTLRLVTNTGGNPGDNDYKDHADWADAKLYSTPAIPKPLVSISKVQDGAEPSTNAVFTISRTGDLSEPLVVDLTYSGLAQHSVDFEAPTQITISAGLASADLVLAVADDVLVEGMESVTVTIAPSSAITIAGSGSATATIADNDLTQPGNGLTAEYFDNADFTGPITTRVDPTLVLGTAESPWNLPMQNHDSFSVRWSGFIDPPETGDYEFSLAADHGARLWIDGRLIIDRWEGTGNTTGSIALTAGQKVGILVEYRELTGDQSLALSWQRPGGVSEFVPTSALTPAEPAVGEPLRILAVGDSITEGEKGHASYRFWLDRLLASTGANVDFVGSRSGVHNSGVGGANVQPIYPWFDQDHQSRWGATLEEVAAYSTPIADIALIHIGHNDIRGGQSPQSLIDELSAYIDKLRTINPNIRIALAQPVKNTSLGFVAEMDQYRALLPGLAAAKTTAASPVLVVDQYTGFEPAQHTYDNVHPNEAGEKQIAARFFEAIRQLSVPSNLPTVTVAATDPTAGEPDDTGTFTFSRTGDTTDALTVHFAVSGGAVAGSDYAPLGSSITIPAGASTATLAVDPIDNDVYESTEQVIVTLTSGDYLVGAGNAAIINITDDEPEPPTVTIEAIDGVGAEAGAGTAGSDDITFRLTRSGDTSSELDVDVAFSGEAEAGVDFVYSGKAQFAAGASEALIEVSPLDDAIIEGNETLTLSILPSQDESYAVGYLDNASAVIIDDDAPMTGLGGGLKGEYFDTRDFGNKIFERIDPTIEFNWGNGAPDSRMGSDTFSVRWTGQIEATHTERYTFHSLSDDGARLWIDDELIIDRFYDQGGSTEWTGSIDLVAGQKYDIKYEYYENVVGARVKLSWSSPSRTKEVIPARHLYTLPEAAVTASDNTASETGDLGAFTFTLAFPRSEPTVVQYTIGGTATNGLDYSFPASVVIPAGAVTHTVTLTPANDDLPEGMETIVVTLIDTDAYFAGPLASATVNLLDDETGPAPAPTITEPAFDDFSFSAFDVHMVIDNWVDPNDPTRPHLSTDWEIWTTGPAAERVWYAHAQTDPTLKVHIHLGDGTFDNSHAGQDRLNFETSYIVRSRVHSTAPTPDLATSNWSVRTFSTRGEITPIPNAPDWTVSEAGYEVQVVATGLKLPTKIAFVPEHLRGSHPSDPSFYVLELYGAVKVITNDGQVYTYASELLNYSPFGGFPGSGEQGAGGLTVDPATGDVIVALVHDQPGDGGNALIPAVIRLKSTNGGLTASSIETIISMPNDPMGPSHQISEVNYGPDGKLYVHLGDGNNYTTAQDLERFRGKIIRLNDDGTAPEDNPFYDDTDGITARDYVFAYGFRNPFGGAFRESDGMLYEVENGPQVDRFAQVRPGENYGWDSTNASMSIGALYNWPLPYAPAGLAFIEPTVFGGSGFESRFYGHAFVAETGPTYATGPQGLGKRITRFNIDADGNLVGGRNQFVAYSGTGKATVADVAAGPDGLYFVDLYRDDQHEGSYNPTAPGARVLRVVYTGAD